MIYYIDDLIQVEVEMITRRLGRNQDFEGDLSFYFVPSSFANFQLLCSPGTDCGVEGGATRGDVVTYTSRARIPTGWSSTWRTDLQGGLVTSILCSPSGRSCPCFGTKTSPCQFKCGTLALLQLVFWQLWDVLSELFGIWSISNIYLTRPFNLKFKLVISIS